ncbi:ceramidase, partial [Ochromonadaceae sp. CCMP2298]
MAHGYWEPHSSSIDFCEPNYLLTEYIAEPHNVWSSALIPLMALTGYLYSNPTHEKRFSVMYLVLGLVGVGSTALHWTLHWIPQSSDELPMLWVSLSIVYALYTTREQRGSTRSRTLGYLFALIGLLESVIYYTFQQIYIVFVLSIVVCTAAVVAWLLWLVRGFNTHTHHRERGFNTHIHH